jgi:hypothetical protein
MIDGGERLLRRVLHIPLHFEARDQFDIAGRAVYAGFPVAQRFIAGTKSYPFRLKLVARLRSISIGGLRTPAPVRAAPPSWGRHPQTFTIPEVVLLHSITSSAVDTSEIGMERPRALAVFRLMTNLNRVGCSTGRSAGFAPFSIWST